MNLLKKDNSEWKLGGLSLFGSVVLLSGIIVGSLSWNVATLFKKWLLKKYNLSLYPWTDIFYHPHEASLINYIFLCIGMGIYGLFFYMAIDHRKIVSADTNASPTKAAYTAVVIFAVIILMYSLKFLNTDRILFIALILTAVFYPLLGLFSARLKRIDRNKLLLVLIGILFVILSLEPGKLIKGPVFLMNEYENLYSETLLEGNDVNNRSYLDNLSLVDIESIKAFYILKNKQKNKITDKSDNIDFLQNPDIKFSDMRPVQNYLNSMIAAKAVTLTEEGINDDILNNMVHIDVESIKQFYLKNQLEYSHQNMSRGQINHIGHILNPINEFATGKPLKDIYFQYGLGNTFIIKWTMELFGKVSIENYYKCYGYYILYFTIFLIMLFTLFKDNIVYILGVFIILAASHYYWLYIGFILAPGIIPTMHMFDVIVLMFLLLYFRHDSEFFMGAAILFAFLALLMNTQFGMMLFVSLFVSLILYTVENKTSVHKYVRLFILSAMFVTATLVPFLITTGKTEALFTYFLLGLFSWPAHKLIIALTICYLVVSYVFLFLLKEKRFYLKYIYTSIFLYTQSLFVYFYWSGLANHLPMVLPFAGLQLFLMIFILEQEFSMSEKNLSLIKVSVLLIAVVFLADGMRQFYMEKADYQNNFTDHAIYHWTFDRANIITTINPKPIEESMSLIWKYSPQRDHGIFIISKYDNLLPFLAERSSYLSFELAWHLLSDMEVTAAINQIRACRPDYLYVDSNIDREIPDPWAKIYKNNRITKERISRIGRYSELQKVFTAVRSDYERIEQGDLLAVYRRKE